MLVGPTLEIFAVTLGTVLRENLSAEHHGLAIEPERPRDAIDRDRRQFSRRRQPLAVLLFRFAGCTRLLRCGNPSEQSSARGNPRHQNEYGSVHHIHPKRKKRYFRYD
jgi:hypothetical protein